MIGKQLGLVWFDILLMGRFEPCDIVFDLDI